MPNTYTPEQIISAKWHIGALERTDIIPKEARIPPYEDRHGQDWALENEALIILAALEAVQKENARLRDENVQDFRMDELDAVMQSVDKWLEGDQLKNNPATRAADAREAALRAIELLAAYAAKLEKAGDFMRRACPMIVARDNWDAARQEKP